MKRTESSAPGACFTATRVERGTIVPRGRAADVDLPDVFAPPASLGIGLDVDPVEAAESVEVVDVGPPKAAWSAVKTSLTGTPRVLAFSRST